MASILQNALIASWILLSFCLSLFVRFAQEFLDSGFLSQKIEVHRRKEVGGEILKRA